MLESFAMRCPSESKEVKRVYFCGFSKAVCHDENIAYSSLMCINKVIKTIDVSW